MDPEVFKDWPRYVQKIQDWSYTLFLDRIVLSVSKLFNPKEKRISKDMKAALQQEGIGYWFSMQKYSVIRVYGFLAAPFMLLVYLTPSVFALELIRQRISADEEHFYFSQEGLLDQIPF